MRLLTLSAALLAIAISAIFALPMEGGLLAWMPSEGEVSKHFEKRHQDLKVLAVTAGEGDSDHRSYMIRYSPRSGGVEQHAEWSVHSSGCLYGWKTDAEKLNIENQLMIRR